MTDEDTPTAEEQFLWRVEEIIDDQLGRTMPPHLTTERQFREDCITQTAYQVLKLMDTRTISYWLPHAQSAEHLMPENSGIPPPQRMHNTHEVAVSRFAYLRFQFTDPNNLPEVCYELQDHLRRGESPSEDGGTVHPPKGD